MQVKLTEKQLNFCTPYYREFLPFQLEIVIVKEEELSDNQVRLLTALMLISPYNADMENVTFSLKLLQDMATKQLSYDSTQFDHDLLMIQVLVSGLKIEKDNLSISRRKLAQAVLPEESIYVPVEEEPSHIHKKPKSGEQKSQQKDDKKAKRLEANRKSSLASRDRKRQLKQKLEGQVVALERENQMLHLQETILESENKVLKAELASLQGIIQDAMKTAQQWGGFFANTSQSSVVQTPQIRNGLSKSK